MQGNFFTVDEPVWGLSAGTGKLCIFGHLGLVFIWSCFVSCLLLLLYYVIFAPVLTEGTLVCSYFNRQEYSIFYSAAFIHLWSCFLFFVCEFKRHESKQKTVAGVFVVDPCASLHHSVQTYLPLPDMTPCGCSVMNDFVRIHCSLLTSEAFISLICGISLRWPTL